MIHLYTIHGNTLKDEGRTIDAKSQITGMAYSDDGAHLAIINEKKSVILYSVADDYAVNAYHTTVCSYTLPSFQEGLHNFPLFQVKNEYYGHHAKPVSLAWSPDNEHFATGGMDMMVFIWTVSDADKRIKIPGEPCRHSRGRAFHFNASDNRDTTITGQNLGCDGLYSYKKITEPDSLSNQDIIAFNYLYYLCCM